MADPASQTQHLLPLDQSEQIFRDHIAPVMLGGAEPQEHPTLVIVTAQPGARKTTISRLLQRDLASHGGSVHIDVDSFYAFHPEYRRFQREDELTADDLVHADARRWLDQSIDHLNAQRVNIVLEHGLRSQPVIDSLLARFPSDGTDVVYDVHAALVATPAPVSAQGILNRYQLGHEISGFGRDVIPELHDERERNLLNVADLLEANSRVRVISVYDRHAQLLSQRTRSSAGRLVPALPTRDALEAERTRLWALDESKEFLRIDGSLTARMAPQWASRLEATRVAATPFLHPDAETPAHDKTAVTYGRYQLVSIAHLDTVRTILQDWPRAVVGLIELGSTAAPPPVADHLREYYRQSEASRAPERNPMTAAERVELWRAAVATAGLTDRIEVQQIPRPGLDPDGFNRRFPAEQYDVVFPAHKDDGPDPNSMRAEILGRPILTVDPPLEYHTSDIRAAYRRGDEELWKRALAPGTVGPFTAVDGPRRLLALGSPPTNPGNAASVVSAAFPAKQQDGDTAQRRAADPPSPPRPPGQAPSPHHGR